MRVLLLVSSFNGLTQRVWCHLREQGHDVSVEFALDQAGMLSAAEAFDPDLVLCPFLKERVPERLWRRWRTVVVHPGPVGDRGPSSLDRAITDGVRTWGVTALQAVEEMDAGPIWATRTFRMPAEPPRKTALYSGPVADAAMDCVDEVLAKAQDPAFAPVPLERAHRQVPGTGASAGDAAGRAGVRLGRAGARHRAPGPRGRRLTRCRARIGGLDVHVFDATPGSRPAHVPPGPPGTVLAHADGSVLVSAGAGGSAGVWLGQLRVPGGSSCRPRRCSAAACAACRGSRTCPNRGSGTSGTGDVGTLTFRPYNGALSARRSRRLTAALRSALRDDTTVLVLRGADDVFCNGIDLNAIEAAPAPAAEAWASIRAINAVCRRVCAGSRQVVVSAISGNAGAGGVMLALGADIVLARAGVVLNPFYDMGLSGSELHTLTLPRRVGEEQAARLLGERLPVDAAQARAMDLVDAVGPRDPAAFAAWLAEVGEWAARDARDPAGQVARRRTTRQRSHRPLSYYESAELAEMAKDMFDDRNGFANRRKAFVHKEKLAVTPARLALHRTGAAAEEQPERQEGTAA